jgi:hypothetical protein
MKLFERLDGRIEGWPGTVIEAKDSKIAVKLNFEHDDSDKLRKFPDEMPLKWGEDFPPSRRVLFVENHEVLDPPLKKGDTAKIDFLLKYNKRIGARHILTIEDFENVRSAEFQPKADERAQFKFVQAIRDLANGEFEESGSRSGVFNIRDKQIVKEISRRGDIDPEEADIGELFKILERRHTSRRKAWIISNISDITENRPDLLLPYVNKIVEGTQSSNPEVKRVSKEMLNRVVASEPNKVKYYTEKIAETAVSNGDIYLFEVLGRIGSPDAIPILEPLKNDKKKNIRMAAEKTMDEIQESQSESGS